MLSEGPISSSKIGIGGSLAAPLLPHHRAYGSVPRRFGWLCVFALHAGLSLLRLATGGSVPPASAVGASPLLSGAEARSSWFFCRFPLMRCAGYLPLQIVRAFGVLRPPDLFGPARFHAYYALC